jgi:hypothetical protein
MAEGDDMSASAYHDHLEALERDECIRRLETHGVGRLGVATRGGIGIFPVNYVVDGDNLVVRVRRDGVLDEGTDGTVVAVEIDEADSMYHEGPLCPGFDGVGDRAAHPSPRRVSNHRAVLDLSGPPPRPPSRPIRSGPRR